MVKVNNISVAYNQALEYFTGIPLDLTDFEDISYGEKTYSALERAEIGIAFALKGFNESKSYANERTLAYAILTKLAVVEYETIKRFEAKEEAAAAKAAKKLIVTCEAATNAVKNPEVKRTRKARVQTDGVGDQSIPPLETKLVDAATASVIAVTITERQQEREVRPIQDILAVGSVSAQAVVSVDPFNEIQATDIKPAVSEQAAVSDFLQKQKEKLAALAGIKPTESSL